MVHISRNETKKVVEKAIGKKSLKEIIEFVGKKKPSLWGKFKGSTHLSDNIITVIYKDLSGEGNATVFKCCKRWLGNSVRSLAHNVKQIRPVLAKWGTTKIIVGDKKIWNEKAEGVEREGPTKRVNLWMDSSDFAVRGTSKKRKKDEYYSFKLKSLGRRFQFIFDGNSVVRSLWGGYSPKLHDSQWCEANKQTLVKDFKGGVIIADEHYRKFSKQIKSPKFVTPERETGSAQTNNPNNLSINIKEKMERNKKVRTVRARVEHPFAIMEKKFKILSKKFADGPEQLDHLVTFAAGVLNVLNDK